MILRNNEPLDPLDPNLWRFNPRRQSVPPLLATAIAIVTVPFLLLVVLGLAAIARAI